MGEISISADDWASGIEENGSSADSVSFGDQNISINDDDDDSGSSSSGSTSSTSDRYGTTSNDDGSYNVPSGTAGAVGPDAPDELQSEQVMNVVDEMEGAYDKQAVTTSVNEDGSTSLTAESNLGEVVTATTNATPFANDDPNEDANPWGNIPKKALLGAAILLFALITGGR